VGASSGWWLAIDFGTSNTAAAHVDEQSGAARVLPSIHADWAMSSAVFVESPTRIEVGEAARTRALTDPSGFLATPKRVLTAGAATFHIGRHDVPAHLVPAALLRAALAEAEALHAGGPPLGLVLTHPEGWSRPQLRTLIDAANEVGYPDSTVRTVPEPVAAAAWLTRDRPLNRGERVTVADFGGGSLDVTVLAATGDGGFDIVAARGDSTLGGRDLDTAVRRWVHRQLSAQHPLAMDTLREGGATSADRRELDEAIRTAKELLSTTYAAPLEVRVGPHHQRLTLTRQDFESLIDPELARAWNLVRATLDAVTGSTGPLFLIGGSARIPLVGERFGALSARGEVRTPDDPQAVVAPGALLATGHRRQSAPAGPARPQAWTGTAAHHRDAAPAAPDDADTVLFAAAPQTRRRRAVTRAGAALLAVVAVVLGVVALHHNAAGTGTATGSTSTAPAPPPTTVTPLVGTVAGTDDNGFAHSRARCNTGDPAMLLARTPYSLVVICRGPSGLYFHGLRRSDNATISLTDPVPGHASYTVTNPADNTRYRIDATALTITRNGELLATEPVLEFAHR
jgi:hypothetical protein